MQSRKLEPLMRLGKIQPGGNEAVLQINQTASVAFIRLHFFDNADAIPRIGIVIKQRLNNGNRSRITVILLMLHHLRTLPQQICLLVLLPLPVTRCALIANADFWQ